MNHCNYKYIFIIVLVEKLMLWETGTKSNKWLQYGWVYFGFIQLKAYEKGTKTLNVYNFSYKLKCKICECEPTLIVAI